MTAPKPLLSFAQVWSFSPLPDAYTLAHYATVFQDSSGMIKNTLLYCSLAAGLDVILGVTIAYLIFRTTLPARQWLDWIATASLAVPGIVLAIGFLRLYKGITPMPCGGCPMRCAAVWPRCSRCMCRWKRPPRVWVRPSCAPSAASWCR